MLLTKREHLQTGSAFNKSQIRWNRIAERQLPLFNPLMTKYQHLQRLQNNDKPTRPRSCRTRSERVRESHLNVRRLERLTRSSWRTPPQSSAPQPQNDPSFPGKTPLGQIAPRPNIPPRMHRACALPRSVTPSWRAPYRDNGLIL